MTTTTLARPGRRPGALIAAGLDPRPCVTYPPQMWDLGNDGNRQAMALCETCPAMDDDSCEITPGTIRRGTPWSDVLHPVKVCRGCGHPRIRLSPRGHVTCKCPNRNRTPDQVVQAWLNADGPNRTIREVAPEIGMAYVSLKAILRRARDAGDTRVPMFHASPTPREQVKAA